MNDPILEYATSVKRHGDARAKKVERLLTETLRREMTSYLNIVNLMELYYILYRKSPALADEKEENLRGYGVN